MKCRNCLKEGFSSPYEIRMHRKECPNTLRPINEIDSPALTNTEVLMEAPAATESVVQDNNVPQTPFTERLYALFADLKSPEGKGAINKILSNSEELQYYSTLAPQEIISHLFSQVLDGDERAIIRRYIY